MDFGKPLRKKNLRKGMTPVIAQKVSRRDLRLINCLIVFEMKSCHKNQNHFLSIAMEKLRIIYGVCQQRK